MNRTFLQSQLEGRRKAIEEAVEEYYTSLRPEEQAELAAWGDFALTEFPEDLR
ncbi:MAG TPA: hypothetical protein VEU96_13110 [Bryobacteraceae bacterium]|nr:hypothetical protein [Bryobacteraceae bacterium]